MGTVISNTRRLQPTAQPVHAISAEYVPPCHYGDKALREFYAAPLFTYGDRTPLMRLLTEDDIQRIDDLIDHTTRLYWPEDDLTDIVWDTLGAYFAGDRTLDDTIRLLNNRVGLYVNELR